MKLRFWQHLHQQSAHQLTTDAFPAQMLFSIKFTLKLLIDQSSTHDIEIQSI
jgi:hypothetical protein